MIKIMIVDDEKIIRKSIINKIEWNENLSCHAEAQDGIEALQTALNIRPDIVITDIRMPQMDGIEFIGRLRQLLPDVQTIFVSSYADFSYIKSALDYESCAYILKPIKKQELNNAVAKAIEKIEKNNLMYQTSQMQLKLLDRLLLSFYSQIPVSIADFQKTLKALHFHLSYFQVLTAHFLEIDESADFIAQIFNSEISFFSRECISRIIPVSSGTYIVFITNTKPFDPIALSRNLINRLSVSYSLDISIVLGRQTESLDDIANIFAEVKNSLNYLHLYSTHEIILPSEEENVQSRLSSEDTLPLSVTREIIDNIYTGDYEGLNKGLQHLQRFITGTPSFTLRSISDMFSRLLSDILRILYERQCSKSVIDQGIALMYKFTSCSLKDDYFHQFQDYCLSITSSLYKTTAVDEIIQQARIYIETHYSEPISLKQLSALYHLNISYFSTSFKAATGKTFSEYLTWIRMEKAKQLLAGKTVKISEAASLSGYEDTSYFGKVFKKYTGMLPNEYRKQLLSKQEAP